MSDGYAFTEIDRRLANVVRIGTISQLDEASGQVKVDVGDLVTDWMPWVTHRAGNDRSWWAPEVGEQVVVLAPSGELSQGVALPSVYQQNFDQPATSKDITRQQWSDGAYQQYDRAAHAYVLEIPAGGSITIKIGGTTLLLEDNKATLTTPQLLVDSPQSTFTGQVLVQGLLTYEAGMAGSGGGSGSAATINGPVSINGNVDTTGTLTNNGTNVGSTHVHNDPQGGTVGTPH